MAGVVNSTSGRADRGQDPVGTINTNRLDGVPEARVAYADGSLRWAPVHVGAAGAFRISEDFNLKAGATLALPWNVRDTSAAGAPVKDYVTSEDGGAYKLALAADAEVESLVLDFNDHLPIDPTKDPIARFRVKITPDVTGAGGALAAGDKIIVGLASAHNATADSVASNVWFAIVEEDILFESDDGTTDDDDNDSGVDWVADTYVDLAIDMSDLSAIGFYVDGVKVGQTSAPLLSGNLQPYLRIDKAAAANFDHVLTIDAVDILVRR